MPGEISIRMAALLSRLQAGEECGPSFLKLLQKLDIYGTFVLWTEP